MSGDWKRPGIRATRILAMMLVNSAEEYADAMRDEANSNWDPGHPVHDSLVEVRVRAGDWTRAVYECLVGEETGDYYRHCNHYWIEKPDRKGRVCLFCGKEELK